MRLLARDTVIACWPPILTPNEKDYRLIPCQFGCRPVPNMRQDRWAGRPDVLAPHCVKLDRDGD